MFIEAYAPSGTRLQRSNSGKFFWLVKPGEQKSYTVTMSERAPVDRVDLKLKDFEIPEGQLGEK